MKGQLIEIKNENGIGTVSARELYEKLGLKSRFNDWFAKMCSYGFEENTDYIAITKKKVTAQGNESKFTDCFISLDMAKEICMIQRSEIGKKFRQYFIECEKELNSRIQPKEISDTERKFGMFDRLHALADKYEPKSETYSQVLDAYATKELTGEFLLPLPETEKTYSAGEIGQILGISANKVGKIANANGLKTEKFGKYFIDKSKYANKEVETFRYNRNGLEEIRRISRQA